MQAGRASEVKRSTVAVPCFLCQSVPTGKYEACLPGPASPFLVSAKSGLRSLPMTQTSNRFFDEVARLMNDAAGVAQGIKGEVDTMFKTQAEKWLRDLDLVKREEFEAVKDMARLAREENEVLRTRIAGLEAKLAPGPAASAPPPPAPPRRAIRPRRGPDGWLPKSLFSFPELAGISPAALGPDTPGGRPRLFRHPVQRDTTMATIQQLKAMARPRGGKGAARAERRQGRVPGVIYGDNKDPLTISVDHAELKRRIYAGRFLSTIYEIELDGAKHRVIPRDFQLDPVKDLPVHVDFMRLGLGAKIRVRIPVHVMNADQAPGVKRGGTVNIVTHAVEVVCSADQIPDSIDVDISSLEINYSKHLSDVPLPPNLRVVGRLDQTLVTI